MFVDINGGEPLETEEEVAEAGAQNDAEAEPGVVSHKDEHEQIAQRDLSHMKERLSQMTSAE